MKKKPTDGFIVIYDDEVGLCTCYGWDAECDGAIEGGSDSVAVFKTRADARKAIEISTCNAKLRKSQGKPANDDFLSYRKHIRIVPLKAKP